MSEQFRTVDERSAEHDSRLAFEQHKSKQYREAMQPEVSMDDHEDYDSYKAAVAERIENMDSDMNEAAQRGEFASMEDYLNRPYDGSEANHIIDATPELRRIELMAVNIAEYENVAMMSLEQKEDLDAKEDKLQELLTQYFDSEAGQSLTADQKNAILDTIIDKTRVIETAEELAPEDVEKAADAPKFTAGQVVSVKNASGETEDGWEVVAAVEDKGERRYKVAKPNGEKGFSAMYVAEGSMVESNNAAVEPATSDLEATVDAFDPTAYYEQHFGPIAESLQKGIITEAEAAVLVAQTQHDLANPTFDLVDTNLIVQDLPTLYARMHIGEVNSPDAPEADLTIEDGIAYYKKHFGTIAKLLVEGSITYEEATRLVEKTKRDLANPTLNLDDTDLIVRNLPAFYDGAPDNDNNAEESIVTTPDTEVINASEPEVVTIEAIEPEEPEALRQRRNLTWAYTRAQLALSGANLSPEQKKSRRKNILKAAVGIIVVGAAIVAVKYGAEAFQTAIDAASEAGSDIPEPNLDPANDPNTYEFSKKALNITKGEGWFNTFKELGITDPGDQAKLLKAAGPDLVKMGIAYEDPELGGYGISRSGKMPEKSLETILKIWEKVKS